MSDCQVINLFTLNVYKSVIKNIDHEKIYNEIKNNSEHIEEKFINDYLKTNNHTYYEDKKFPNNLPECTKLKSILLDSVNSILGKEMKLDTIWTLTLKKGESVSYHNHKSNTHMFPSEYYSIAYYPNAPEDSAKLLFNTTACNVVENITSITPNTGDLILFNSFIPHMTTRHMSEEPRVVVSANFSPVNPNTTVVPDWSPYWDKEAINE
jgi:hypothetical protein